MKPTRWLMGDKTELYLVIISLVISFAILIAMVLFLSQALIEREDLKMQSEAERSFNSIYLSLQDGDAQKAQKTMEDEKVTGIGIYDSTGRRVMSLGQVPQVLDITGFSLHNGQQSIETGIINYNTTTGLIEYLRYSRLNILLDTGNLALTSSGLLTTPLDFPDVLYVVLNGTAYHRRIVGLRILGYAASIILAALLFLVLQIYLKNREYRSELSKQENLVSLGQAARTLTHEIKNPLSAITIQLALLKKTLPASHHKDLKVMESEVQRLTQLTNKVSDFLRNPLGNPTVIDLNALFGELCQTFERPVSFVAKGNERILMDPGRARSVFENLLKNAMESCQGRDPQVSVEIRDDKRGKIHILVMDRGDGIPRQDAKKIFDPFFTTKIHGSGIGLAISRQFVKARGGDLKLYGRDGGGTVAEVIMPSSLHLE
ncbi:MAG: ATP-binding protein [Sphaerochaeta sp.]|nr:ATP-binding protein [Sphaerochaeta sp.]